MFDPVVARKMIDDVMFCFQKNEDSMEAMDRFHIPNQRVWFADRSFSTIFPQLVPYVKDPQEDPNLVFDPAVDTEENLDKSRKKIFRGLEKYFPKEFKDLKKCLKEKKPVDAFEANRKCNFALMTAAFPLFCKRAFKKCAEEAGGVDNMLIRDALSCSAQNFCDSITKSLTEKFDDIV